MNQNTTLYLILKDIDKTRGTGLQDKMSGKCEFCGLFFGTQEAIENHAAECKEMFFEPPACPGCGRDSLEYKSSSEITFCPNCGYIGDW